MSWPPLICHLNVKLIKYRLISSACHWLSEDYAMKNSDLIAKPIKHLLHFKASKKGELVIGQVFEISHPVYDR